MSNYLNILALFIILLTFGNVSAQDSTLKKISDKSPTQQGFIDLDGDGYNDNAPDHDGDGIPNGLDPDFQKQNNNQNQGMPYVDLDGDGINDNAWGDHNSGQKMGIDRDNIKRPDRGNAMDNKGEMQKGQRKSRRGAGKK